MGGMKQRAGLAYLSTVAAALAFALWTWLTVGTDALAGLDAGSASPGPDPWSRWGQVLAAIGVVTMPVVQGTLMLGLAWWAVRRRLHNLAWAMGLAVLLTWGSVTVVKVLVARPRPASALPLITAEGWSYPSHHVAAATAFIVLGLASVVLRRRRRGVLVAWTVVALVAWWVIALNRWWLRAHYPTDIVGGALLGGTMAAAALALAGVHVVRLPDLAPRPRPGRQRRAAVIVNPTKITDWSAFADQVQGTLTQHGWGQAEWHLTTAADPGTAGARRARRSRVDLAFVAGGDGTVRAVCAELAGSGIPLGILPVGTGNLLARNLGIPLDLADAVEAALEGRARPLDLVELRADGGELRHSVVMAGLGADAAIMADTRDDLKRVVGSGAYVVSALQAITRPPFAATITLDSGHPIVASPAMVLVANVGRLQGNIELVPGAQPDDGLLDVLVASPKGVADWAVLTSRILAGAPEAATERLQAHSVVIEASGPVPYQVDGDPAGVCTRLEASVLPGVVHVMVP